MRPLTWDNIATEKNKTSLACFLNTGFELIEGLRQWLTWHVAVLSERLKAVWPSVLLYDAVSIAGIKFISAHDLRDFWPYDVRNSALYIISHFILRFLKRRAGPGAVRVGPIRFQAERGTMRSNLALVFLPHAVNCGRFCFWRRQSVVFCLSRNIPLNGFAPDSYGRRAWPLARVCLKVKVKSQRSRSPGTQNDIFRPFRRLAYGLCLVKHL